MINGEPAEPLACICHRDKSYTMGRGLVDALKAGLYKLMSLDPPHLKNACLFSNSD